LSYTQIAPSGLLAGNVAQLGRIATEVLAGDPRLSGLRIAFVAHSRGGILARLFLAGAPPALLSRVTALVSLHSPHLGSGVANAAGTVDALAARLQAAFATAGLPPPGILGMLRAMAGNPAFMEIMVGSSMLAGLAASEPAGGVAYHTFGGTSTAAARLWADLFTPDSGIPLPLIPFPFFHWTTATVPVGMPLDISSFAPVAPLLAVPLVTEILTVLGLLTAVTPELAPGAGDLLVADSRAHLPFSASRTTNALNHAEALWDPTLQAQVSAILLRLRTPGVSGRAATQIRPRPVSVAPASHTVTASDAVSGIPLSSGTVTVQEPEGGVGHQGQLGVPFTYSFRSKRIRTFDPEARRWEVEVLWPTVTVALPPPYGTVDVDTGR